MSKQCTPRLIIGKYILNFNSLTELIYSVCKYTKQCRPGYLKLENSMLSFSNHLLSLDSSIVFIEESIQLLTMFSAEVMYQLAMGVLGSIANILEEEGTTTFESGYICCIHHSSLI